MFVFGLFFYFDDARAAARALGPGVLRSTVNCHSPAILTVSDAFGNERR
jgi:hypothetical protein